MANASKPYRVTSGRIAIIAAMVMFALFAAHTPVNIREPLPPEAVTDAVVTVIFLLTAIACSVSR